MRSFPAALRRLIVLFALAVRYLPLLALAVVFRRKAAPRLLRVYLERSGAAFVKLGQVLALRYDMLPLPYCRELERLLDEAPPIPLAAIERTLRRELGAAYDRITLDPEPLGSASVAQVHGARLPSGEDVAVKILRPGIEHRIRFDTWLLRAAARVIDVLPLLGSFRLSPLAAEIERLMREELDLLHEARNADLLHRLMASDDIDHCAPKIYFAYTTRRVLTMQRFRGVWMRDILRAIERDDTAQLEAWRSVGITPRRTARLLFRSFLTQAYRHRVLHADPHPGNLVILESGTLAYVDFGMVGWLDERIWGQQYRLLEAVATRQIHASVIAMLDVVRPTGDADLERFEREFKELVHGWLTRDASQAGHDDWFQRSSGGFLLRATLLMRRCRMRVPSETMRLHRAALVSDMVQLKLYPHLQVAGEMRAFFASEGRRRLCESLVPGDQALGRLVRAWRSVQLAQEVGASLLEWSSANMPSILRSIRQATRLEDVFGLVLGFLRVVVLATIPLVLIGWRSPALWGEGAPAIVRQMPRISLWDSSLVLAWCISALLIAMGLQRVRRRMQ